MNARKITQTFNGYNEWIIAGGYFKLLTAAYAVTVELFMNGQQVLEATGADAGFYQRLDFDRVAITAPVSQAVSFLVAPAEGGSDRLVGAVSVVDGGRLRTLANESFLAHVESVAVPGQKSNTQLKNPVGSGIRVVINSILPQSAAQTLQMRQYDANLTTLSGVPQSKLFGGAVGLAQLRSQNSVGALSAATVIQSLEMPSTDWVPLSEPIILLPGVGMMLSGTADNTAIGLNLELNEEANV